MEQYQQAIDEIARSFQFMLDTALSKTTKIYEGLITKVSGGSATIKFNGELHEIKQFGNGQVSSGDSVKVIVPQGNMNLAWFMPRNIGSISEAEGTSQNVVTSFNGETGDVVYTPPVTSVNNQTGRVQITPQDIGAVPNTTTINGVRLSGNITLIPSDLGIENVGGGRYIESENGNNGVYANEDGVTKKINGVETPLGVAVFG